MHVNMTRKRKVKYLCSRYAQQNPCFINLAQRLWYTTPVFLYTANKINFSWALHKHIYKRKTGTTFPVLELQTIAISNLTNVSVTSATNITSGFLLSLLFSLFSLKGHKAAVTRSVRQDILGKLQVELCWYLSGKSEGKPQTVHPAGGFEPATSQS